MKAKSAAKLAVVIALIAVVAFFTFVSAEIGDYRITAMTSSLSRGVDVGGGVYAVYGAGNDGSAEFRQALDKSIAIMKSRLTAQGFGDAPVVRQGESGVRVEIPYTQSPEQLFRLIGAPAVLEFLEPDGTVILTGSNIISAAPYYNSETGRYSVAFALDEEGTAAFAEATERLIGQTIDVTLDGDSVFGSTLPTVNAAITDGIGAISGGYTYETAGVLTSLILEGSLPLTFEIMDMRVFSAGLGENALSSLLIAGAIGAALVVLFLIAAYRVPGVAGVISLAAFAVLEAVGLVLFSARLSLAGIAGILLTFGLTAGALIFIFEGIKDELKSGEMLRPSVSAGFKRAMRPIIDAGVLLLITAVALALAGTGVIDDFAVALGAGAVSGVIVAALVRYLLAIAWGFGFTNKRMYGLNAKEASVK